MAQVAAGDREGARRSWERALRFDPHLVPARYNLALLARNSGHRREALRLLETCVVTTRKEAPVWRALGETALDVGDLVRARQAFQAAVDLQPADESLWSGLAEAALLSNEWSLARMAVDRASALNANDQKVRVLGALITIQDPAGAARWPVAERELQAAYDIPALRADAAFGLGILRVRQRDPAAAVPYLREAVESNPANMAARYQLAQALMAAGRRAEGERCLRNYERLFRAVTAVVGLRARQESDPQDKNLQREFKAAERAREDALHVY